MGVRYDIAFTSGGVYGPQVTVNPEDSDAFSLVEAFAVFLRYFGEDFTVSRQGGDFLLQGPDTDELEDDDIPDFGEAFGVLEEAGLMEAVPEEPQVPRDIRTGLAIPAPGFPWTDTKGPVVLKEPAFAAGDLVEVAYLSNAKHHFHYALGDRFTVTEVDKEGDLWDDRGYCVRPQRCRKVTPEPKPTTEFKQGDLVKVIRITHDDDAAVLDRVGSVIGVDVTHTNGQTVHASFWDLEKGEDKPWWVHKDSLDLVYRPGSSS